MDDIHALIPIIEQRLGAGDAIPTVNGRHIWQWLHIRQEYATWIKRQIESLHLVENKHYIVFDQKEENSGRVGRPLVEYHFTVDAAKHIVMTSRTPRGAEARDYFIAVEERYTHGAMETEGDMLVRMAIAWRDQERRLKALEEQERERQRQLMAAQEDVIALQRDMLEAKTNALLAIESMQWVTIRQYVEIYRMQRQMPSSIQRRYAIWLNTYCLEHNSAMYKATTADKEWPHEKTYCIAVIQKTLSGWLQRYGNSTQGSLDDAQALPEEPPNAR